MTLAAALALTAAVAGTHAVAQTATAPTDTQRALLTAHYKAYSAEGDAAAILPTTTSANWANCGANGANCQTRQELIGMLGGLKKGVPDLKWEILEMVASGDTVVVRGQGSGTPQGSLVGVPTNGKSFKVMSIDIQTIQGGKITHTYHLEDWADAMRQVAAH
jgi:predicted ester cyclase